MLRTASTISVQAEERLMRSNFLIRQELRPGSGTISRSPHSMTPCLRNSSSMARTAMRLSIRCGTYWMNLSSTVSQIIWNIFRLFCIRRTISKPDSIPRCWTGSPQRKRHLRFSTAEFRPQYRIIPESSDTGPLVSRRAVLWTTTASELETCS